MIEVASLLADSKLLQVRIADAVNAVKAAGDIERYGILAAAETVVGSVSKILGDPRLRAREIG